MSILLFKVRRCSPPTEEDDNSEFLEQISTFGSEEVYAEAVATVLVCTDSRLSLVNDARCSRIESGTA